MNVMQITTMAFRLKVDQQQLIPLLQQANEKLSAAEGEMVLDFSTVRRIDPASLTQLEKLADASDSCGSKVVLQGVNVNVYKVLKLVKLAPRFSFIAKVQDGTEKQI